jgi:hypothetical protein
LIATYHNAFPHPDFVHVVPRTSQFIELLLSAPVAMLALSISALPVPPTQMDLKEQIVLLIDELDSHQCEPVAIAPLSARFGIKTRRLYDFINILSAIGCCRKSGLGHLIWLGRHQIPPRVSELCKAQGIVDPNLTLSDLFPVSDCVGMANLTQRFMLMFHAVRTNRLDLRFVGNLFSLKTTRYKSTLCKLYQIAFVLCAAGVCDRTSQVCQVVLCKPYIDFPTVEAEKAMDDDPTQINSLLNRKKENETTDCALRRRKEMLDLFLASAASKTVMLPDDDLSPSF